MKKVILFPGVRRSYPSPDAAEQKSDSASSVVISAPHVEVARLRRMLLAAKRRLEE